MGTERLPTGGNQQVNILTLFPLFSRAELRDYEKSIKFVLDFRIFGDPCYSGPIEGAKYEGAPAVEGYCMGLRDVFILCAYWRRLFYGY